MEILITENADQQLLDAIKDLPIIDLTDKQKLKKWTRAEINSCPFFYFKVPFRLRNYQFLLSDWSPDIFQLPLNF